MTLLLHSMQAVKFTQLPQARKGFLVYSMLTLKGRSQAINLIICMLLIISFMSPTRLSVQIIKERRNPIRRADTLAARQHRNITHTQRMSTPA